MALQLFGVMPADPAHDSTLPRGTSVVVFRDLAALVANARYARVAAAPDAVHLHHSIVEAVFDQRVILPAPFGTIFESHDTLMRWLELHYVTLAEAVTFVEDRVMVRVLVRAVDGAPAAAAGQTPEAATAVRSVAAETFRVLRRHAVASVPVARGDSPDNEVVSSFLIDRDKWALFADLVREEQQRLPGGRVESSGPWPPYDFVQMQFGG